MKIKKEFVNQIIELYQTKSILSDYPDKEDYDTKGIEEIDNQIRESADEIMSMLKSDDFLKILRKLIKENKERFQVAFAEPYDEDLINIIAFDLYKKKIISKKDINELKSFYSDKKISIAIES